MALTRNKNSSIIHAELVSVDSVIFWDRVRINDIPARDDDQPYIVKQGEFLDNLANRQLGSPQLGWVILVRNNLSLFPNDLVPGAIIYIPSIIGLKERGIL